MGVLLPLQCIEGRDGSSSKWSNKCIAGRFFAREQPSIWLSARLKAVNQKIKKRTVIKLKLT